MPAVQETVAVETTTPPVVAVAAATEEPVSEEDFVASVVENLHPSSAELVREHILPRPIPFPSNIYPV